jgi:hypothetical protein
VAADGDVERKLARPNADLRLEPLPSVRNQVHGRDRRPEYSCSEFNDVVERGFALRIQDAVSIKCGQSIGFIAAVVC